MSNLAEKFFGLAVCALLALFFFLYGMALGRSSAEPRVVVRPSATSTVEDAAEPKDRVPVGFRPVAKCPEDSVLQGTGEFEDGRWSRYVCGPGAVDDYLG